MKTTKKTRAKSNWVKVGEISVDAGLVWIGDPCYVLHKKKLPGDMGKDWGDFCGKLHDDDRSPTMRQFRFDSGHPGLGVCVQSGFGDGCYDVKARVENVPGWGKRVCEIKIVFVKPSERRQG